MAERPEDLNLPNAVIARIIKDALPEGVIVSKDARLAISKAASVFVLYATSCANNFAMNHKRKTIAPQDVIESMKEMEFERFVTILKQSLDAYKDEQKSRKASNQKKKEAVKEDEKTGGDESTETPKDGASEDANADENVEEEEPEQEVVDAHEEEVVISDDDDINNEDGGGGDK